MKKPFFSRWDLLLYGAVALLIAVSLVFCLPRPAKDPENGVVVEVDGKQVAEFSLREDLTYEIHGIGGSNLLVIQDGQARISQADCPDKVCVHTGIITETSPAVCRPHRVVVYLKEAGV